MSALLKEFENNYHYIHQDIRLHPAWLDTTGLKAEKMLRNLSMPYRYILRAGETSVDYYVTFNHPDGSVRHQPVNISVSSEGWSYENGAPRGPFTEPSINDVVHFIMHCEKDECAPFNLVMVK